MKIPKLGVNIDHVATVRQARRTFEPDPVTAAALATLGGAEVITAHLREDRRHINDRDLRLLRETVFTKLNLEMACVPEIVGIALKTRPEQVTLVPEKRAEVTTEGGLDVARSRPPLARDIARLKKQGILVSLFIDADLGQVRASAERGADAVELHTGPYANARGEPAQTRHLERLLRAAEEAAPAPAARQRRSWAHLYERARARRSAARRRTPHRPQPHRSRGDGRHGARRPRDVRADRSLCEENLKFPAKEVSDTCSKARLSP